MRVSAEDRKNFFDKKNILENAKITLKSEFIGLDDIINEVIDLIESWYLSPDGQMRPTIINLFGMTGVGKTSLIKRLFELIDLNDSLYKFDVGDYASQDNNKLSFSFSEQLKNRERQQIGIIFDEFQLGRTINEDGAELEKSGLRAMWDLLDSGKISILQSSFYGTRTYQLTIKLEDCIDSGGVEVKNGLITKNASYHKKFFDDKDSDDDSKKKKKKKIIDGESETEDKSLLFVPEDFCWYINSIWENRFITEKELKEYLKTLDHHGTIEFLNDTLKKAFKPIEFDYSTSCIFVIGNIDEAYRMTKSFDPDSDADRFYKHSLKITLPQIKNALKKRFRAEQIARLGNNHVIYPAFNSKAFRDLISLEINKTKKKVQDKFGLDINFDKSVNQIIYKEGVFPTQGSRPVFTTISSLIESYIGKIIKDIYESGKEVCGIDWKFSRNKYTISFNDSNNNQLFKKEYEVRLKVEKLRRTDRSELQAQVAIHEAGHAIAAIYGAQLLPSEVVSKTANISEGHCVVDLPTDGVQTKDIFKKSIIIALGGYVAERFIFGEDNVSSGTKSDFERATSLALEMSKQFGMLGKIPMVYGQKHANFNFDWSSSSVDQADDIAADFIDACHKECISIIEKNKLLLLRLGEYLSNHSKMDSKLIKEYVDKYGTHVELKDSGKYFNFKEKIKDGINSISQENS